jgi:hypothetical protein
MPTLVLCLSSSNSSVSQTILLQLLRSELAFLSLLFFIGTAELLYFGLANVPDMTADEQRKYLDREKEKETRRSTKKATRRA